MVTALNLSIYAQGMVTAVGFSGVTTCAAMRGGVSGIQIDNLWDSTAGDYMSVGRPHLPQWWEGSSKWARVVAPAIVECLTAVQEEAQLSQLREPDEIPILVVLPPMDRPLRHHGLEQTVLDGLAHELGRPLPQGSQAIAGGRTGILPALRAAQELFGSRRAELCIVAGVESYLRQALVEHYLEKDRLMCADNSSGFVLGEAGCAVLVGRSSRAGLHELMVTGAGQGTELSGIGGDEDNTVTGQGLTTAVRQALSQARLQYYNINLAITDLNGEHFRFKEHSLADGRLDRVPPGGHSLRPYGYMEIWHPIEYLGEIGAALFPCMLGWAFEIGRKGYGQGPHILLHAGEDNGDRVAIVTQFKAKEASP